MGDTDPAAVLHLRLSPTHRPQGDDLNPDRVGPDLAAGRGYLGFVRNGWMETLAIDMVTGRIDHVVVLPRPTYLPF